MNYEDLLNNLQSAMVKNDKSSVDRIWQAISDGIMPKIKSTVFALCHGGRGLNTKTVIMDTQTMLFEAVLKYYDATKQSQSGYSAENFLNSQIQYAVKRAITSQTQVNQDNFASEAAKKVVNAAFHRLRCEGIHNPGIEELHEETRRYLSRKTLEKYLRSLTSYSVNQLDEDMDEDGAAHSNQSPAPSAESEVFSKHNVSEIMEHVNGLPDNYRNVIKLVRLNGLSIKQASEELDMSEGQVKDNLRHGTDKLRKQMGMPCATVYKSEGSTREKVFKNLDKIPDLLRYLSENQQKVATDYFINGKTVTEIATERGVSEPAVFRNVENVSGVLERLMTEDGYKQQRKRQSNNFGGTRVKISDDVIQQIKGMAHTHTRNEIQRTLGISATAVRKYVLEALEESKDAQEPKDIKLS
jgi:RNA polymerase sigma factor (sigma-70 family)